MTYLSRRTLLGWSGALGAVAVACPAWAQGTRVGPADLSAALASAKGGETFLLTDGPYGVVDIVGHRFADRVTLRADHRARAVFDQLFIRDTHNLRVEGVHVSHPGNGGPASTIVAVTEGSRAIQIVGCQVNGKIDADYTGHYGLYTNDQVRDVVFAGNFVHHVRVGGVFYNAQGLTVSGNTVDHVGGDSFKFIAVQDALIEYNMGARHIFSPPSEHNDFIQFQGAPSSNLVIRGNVSLPRSIPNVQGIFLDDARYTNVLIEHNVIVSSMIRGISTSDCVDCEVRFNTLINIAGQGSKATKVMGFERYHGNIETSHRGDAGQGANLTLQNTHPNRPFYYGALFANPEAGQAMQLQDLLQIGPAGATRFGAVGTVERFLGK